jgi:hypothetical protein
MQSVSPSSIEHQEITLFINAKRILQNYGSYTLHRILTNNLKILKLPSTGSDINAERKKVLKRYKEDPGLNILTVYFNGDNLRPVW